MSAATGIIFGFLAYFTVRYLIFGFYTVAQNERAVKTSFGRAQRLPGPGLTEGLEGDELERYDHPRVRVIQSGGPYFKWPWEKVHKVSIATETISMAYDPETPSANSGGRILESVTKDQLNTGLTGQLRYQVTEKNLYAYLFGVKNPLAHVMGYFISVLRQRIADFEAPPRAARADDDDADIDIAAVGGVSINDLRKNLQEINDHMLRECASSEARYGIVLEASLITGVDPPQEVDSALAAINTAHNEVSSDLSLASAHADQKIVQSKRAVEIETLNAQAEVEPLEAMARELGALKQSGPQALGAYLRNVRLDLFGKARRAFVEVKS